MSLDFVVAAANLRATNYNIPAKSKFDVKCELIRILCNARLHASIIYYVLFVLFMSPSTLYLVCGVLAFINPLPYVSCIVVCMFLMTLYLV